jgi:hypothetical protein
MKIYQCNCSKDFIFIFQAKDKKTAYKYADKKAKKHKVSISHINKY